MEYVPVIADVESEEALLRLREFEAQSQSIDDADRIEAAEGMLSALNHKDPEVVSKGLDIAQWLLSHELFGNISESMKPVDIQSEEAVLKIEKDGEVFAFAMPDPSSRFTMTHPLIQKSMVRELMYATHHEDESCAERGLVMLGIMALDSAYSQEAMRALGYAGRETIHPVIAKEALEILNSLIYTYSPGKLMNFEEHMEALFMGIQAISERNEQPLTDRANEIRFQALESEMAEHPHIIEKSMRSYLLGMNSYGWETKNQ